MELKMCIANASSVQDVQQKVEPSNII